MHFLKWGGLVISLGSVLVAVLFFLQPQSRHIQVSKQYNVLGGLQNMTMSSRGRLNFFSKSASANERFMSLGAITTSLVTYYNLSGTLFECSLNNFGQARFEADAAQLDKLMNHLRLRGPVSIRFDSGYSATAQRVDINLKTGRVNPVSLSINIDGLSVPAGSRKWQIN